MAKTALVISGGGSKGAFAVGALSYIHEHVRPIDQFDIYCGTSTGSLIVPLAAIGELELLKQIYTTTRQTDVLNMGGILNLLSQVSLHDASPLKHLLEINLTSARFDKLKASARQVFLATVCLQNERLTYFSIQPAASADAYDVVQMQTVTDLQRAMLASSCQPVFMQPIEWRPGANPVRQFVDGGIRELTPFQAAIDQGAETIIAITNNPAHTPEDNEPIKKAMGMLERTIDLFSEDVGSNDYRLATFCEQTNVYLNVIRAKLISQGVSPSIVDLAFAQGSSPVANTPVKQIVSIRPDVKLTEGGPGGLTFDPALMQQMFQKGIAAAKTVFTQTPVENVIA
ncbi:patatin-like phospholipase family protein [Spirosoma sp. KNUC1025]|uniref:patatin-like phospholipase family protein n=1 Tax=Spirosoma sp. KNUC1025 TaxID=2894082 RepID=UPI00386A1190|nr:patatin-like phospholipase family protein [Spirosoma sp. KNUC1025]